MSSSKSDVALAPSGGGRADGGGAPSATGSGSGSEQGDRVAPIARGPTLVAHHFGDAAHPVHRVDTADVALGKAQKKRHLLTRPRLRQYWIRDEEAERWVLFRESRERRAAWLDLFFDLVFVTVFGQFSHELELHGDSRGLFQFAVLFTAVWRCWMATSAYVNWFAPNDLLHRAYVLLQMIAVMGMGVHSSRGVALSYLVSRFLTASMQVFSAYYEPRVRRAVVGTTVAFLLGGAPWALSLLLEQNGGPDPKPSLEHLYYWSAGLAVDVVIDLLVTLTKRLSVPVNWELATERVGLLTIVVMGETVIAVFFIAGDATSETYEAALCGGIIIFSVFVVYFDVEAGRQKRHALVSGSWRAGLWHLLHLPFMGALLVMSVTFALLIGSTERECDASVENVLCVSAGHGFTSFNRLMLGASGAMVWLSLIGFALVNRGMPTVLVRKRYRLALRLLTAVAFSAVAYVDFKAAGFDAGAKLGALAVACGVTSLVDYYGGIAPPPSSPDDEGDEGAIVDDVDIEMESGTAGRKVVDGSIDYATELDDSGAEDVVEQEQSSNRQIRRNNSRQMTNLARRGTKRAVRQ